MTMMHRKTLRPLLVALATVAALAGTSATWATALPPVQTQGTVSYVTGGVGKDSAAAFQAASKDWPAMLEFVVKSKPRDDYLANVKVQVRDAKGHTLLEATSEGPFVLARLAPGTYDVKATFGGKTLDRKLHVQTGQHVREVFVWPAADIGKQG
jgi:hypothetical protein